MAGRALVADIVAAVADHAFVFVKRGGPPITQVQ